jgi:hypothetical protein
MRLKMIVVEKAVALSTDSGAELATRITTTGVGDGVCPG